MIESRMQRRPFRNFFLKKSLQFSIIIKITVIMIISSSITIALLALIYNAKSRQGNFFYMSNNVMQELELTNILGIVLPALIVSQFIVIVISFAIGLFSSRKAAVPIYKLEKWAMQVKKGKLKTHLGFRENKEMKELTIQCNALVDRYRHLFNDIEQSLAVIEHDSFLKSSLVSDEIKKLKTMLSTLEYQGEVLPENGSYDSVFGDKDNGG